MTTFGKTLAVLAASAVGFAATVAMAEPDQGSIARGGKLYDKWYKVIGVEAPAESHPLYPASNEKYANDPASNWRCKECHGWDGLGAAGAYKSGGHATGIKGIEGMAGAEPAAIVAVLTSAEHGYGDKLSETDLNDLANFVAYGAVDWSLMINDDKSIKGDAAKGAQVYGTICVNCHGVDGKQPKEMPPLGSLMGNPWEVAQKLLNGQPAEVMPALRALDRQVVADVLAHIATLPAE